MSGSLRRFGYVSDDGEVYSINRDESNVESLNAANGGAGSIPSTGINSLPQGYGTRYALLYQVSNPQIKRKVAILSPIVFAALNGATDFNLAVVGAVNSNFRISSLIGERREGLTNTDTGQNDGDADIVVV